MLKKKKNYYVLEKFEKQKSTIHGFSGRKLGNMSFLKEEGWQNIDKFLNILKLDEKNLVLMEQVHGKRVKRVEKADRGKVIKGADGLVTDKINIILGVKTADCLPILFFDPKKKIIGVAHGGWRGILSGVVSGVVKKMVELGAHSSDVLVGIGPHIRGCCYTILPDRAKLFKEKFGNLARMISLKDGKIHFDLVMPAVFQLKKLGVREEDIEIGQDCTSCKTGEFFSFRKEGENMGMQLGVISLIN